MRSIDATARPTCLASSVWVQPGSRTPSRYIGSSAHLEPGGVLLIERWLPYTGPDAESWSRWLSGRRTDLPAKWPEDVERPTLADGDELELLNCTYSFDPLAQQYGLEIKARLWHGGAILRGKQRRPTENGYFAQEPRLMLEAAGFVDVYIEGPLTGVPVSPDDDHILLIAHRP